MTIKLYLSPYAFYFLLCLYLALAWHFICIKTEFLLPPNSLIFFISFSLLIWHSPKSFWLNFWIPVSFLILPPYLLVVQLLSILSLKYLLFNLFHFILITTTIFNVLISKNSQNLYFQDLFILIKSIEDSKEPCLYVLTLIHI